MAMSKLAGLLKPRPKLSDEDLAAIDELVEPDEPKAKTKSKPKVAVKVKAKAKPVDDDDDDDDESEEDESDDESVDDEDDDDEDGDGDEDDGDEEDDAVISKPAKRVAILPKSTKKGADSLLAKLAAVKGSNNDGGMRGHIGDIDGDSLAEMLENADVAHYSHDSDEISPWARVLLLGPAKMGKTTSILTSAPGPILLLNCDGKGAAQPATRYGAQFDAIEVGSPGEWQRAIRVACSAAERGFVRTVVIDSLSLLSDTLERQLDKRFKNSKNKYAKWTELHRLMMHEGIHKLRDIEAHLFLISHMTAVDDSPAGILPSMSGKSGKVIPGVVNDWILFDYDPDVKPRRAFLVGPQNKWGYSGRNISRSIRLRANAMDLIEELGLTP